LGQKSKISEPVDNTHKIYRQISINLTGKKIGTKPKKTPANEAGMIDQKAPIKKRQKPKTTFGVDQEQTKQEEAEGHKPNTGPAELLSALGECQNINLGGVVAFKKMA